MSRSSKNKLKKAGNSTNQSKLSDHKFTTPDKDNENISDITPKRKRKRSKKSKEQGQEQPSPEQPTKKQIIEEADQLEPTTKTGNMDPIEGIEEEHQNEIILSADQLQMQKAIIIAIRKTNKEDLKTLLSPITRDVNILLGLKDSLEQQTLELQNMKLENNELKKRCTNMENEQDQLKRRISILEDMKLEGNVIFHGVPESQWESEPDLKEKIYVNMSKTITGEESDTVKLEKVKTFKIATATRLGPKSENRIRPVRVKYENTDAASTLLSNKKKLPTGIYVDKEYSTETTKNRRILRPYFNAAKKSSEYFKKCRMDGDVLILKSKRYTVNNLHELPEQLNGFHASSRSDTDTFAFFGEANPLSNFHPSNFEVNDQRYINGEQYIQSEKANYFKDDEMRRKILDATSGSECKRLAREIKNYRHEEWKRVAREICEPGLEAKYVQNTNLKNLLCSTGDKLIVEASRDKVWGTGVPLNHTDVLHRNKWSGNGILSDILMYIRSKHEVNHDPAMDTAPLVGTTS